MIKLLSNDVVNKIAAGEVVERPASVLKELIENSIDAGATDIKVYIKDFGTSKIQVIDNGRGIERTDFENIFVKHATSKISDIEDLHNINSFGFRGEALASISSVSKVSLSTKHKADEFGSEIIFENGRIDSIKPSAISQGTDIQILNLFENIPARKKFLKSKSTENKALLDVFNKFILANSEISFFIDIDGLIKSYPAESSKSRVSKLTKIESENLVEITYDGNTKVSGFVVHPRVFLKNKNTQFIFVNKRPVSDSTVYKAVFDGYDTFLMKNQYPGFVVFLDLKPLEVDVNVHPRKTEVRFINNQEIYKSVRTAVNVNLTKYLKNETLQKLNIQNEQTPQVQVVEVAEEFLLRESQESYAEENLAEEFEKFLLEEKPAVDVQQVNQEAETPISKSQTIQQSILFNQELIAEETSQSSMYLDFANSTQLLDSYIVTSNGKDVLIIDQHAASERYFYEKYLKQLNNKTVESKMLLFPEIVNLDYHECKLIEENRELFNSLGFDFELFGDDEIKFNHVPEFVKMDNFSKIIHKITNDLLEFGEITNVKDKIYHEIAATLACHTAVRFGDKLTKEEIIQILKNLSKCEDPYNCPHGRPVIQEFSKYEIEKKFKRCGL